MKTKTRVKTTDLLRKQVIDCFLNSEDNRQWVIAAIFDIKVGTVNRILNDYFKK